MFFSWKTVKPLVSNRYINKDGDLFLSNDGEIETTPIYMQNIQ